MAGFLGSVETFQATAASDVTFNAIIVSGCLVGVTHRGYKSGDTVVAYLPTACNRYIFACDALAGAQTQGTKVYVTSGGAISFTATSNTLIGILYSAAAVGATEVDVITLLPTA